MSIDISALDPGQLSNNPVRSLGGASKVRPVTLGVPFGEYARWIYVGVTTDLTYVDWTGTTNTLPNLGGGFLHPLCAIEITATSAGAATDLFWGS